MATATSMEERLMGETVASPLMLAGKRLEPAGNGQAAEKLSRSGVGAMPRRPWQLPEKGLVVFHGGEEAVRLSHYFLPRLLMEGKRVLFLDGANCADPRLMARFARERQIAFEQFSRHIQIARAFTCFQLTELIERVPRFLAAFPAEALIVTALPELYFDEDARDWEARVAFEQALASLRRWSQGPSDAGWPAIAVFSAATTFTTPPSRHSFFSRLSAAAGEVWRFRLNEDRRMGLVCERRAALPGVKEAPDGPNGCHFS